MRSFCKDRPEVMSFTLGNSKKVYTMPLASSMPIDMVLRASEIQSLSGDAKAHESLKFQRDLVGRYIGDKVHELSAGEVQEIFAGWAEESKLGGATLGE